MKYDSELADKLYAMGFNLDLVKKIATSEKKMDF